MSQGQTRRTWGSELKSLRLGKGISKYHLADTSGVAQSNVLRFESEERGVPVFGTVFQLAIGLGLDRHGKQDFMQFSLFERLGDELYGWCLYFFLASVEIDGFDDIIRFVELQKRTARRTKDENAGYFPTWYKGNRMWESTTGTLTLDRAYAILVEVAEGPEYADERRLLAAQVVPWIHIDIQNGTCQLTATDGQDESRLVALAQLVLDSFSDGTSRKE